MLSQIHTAPVASPTSANAPAKRRDAKRAAIAKMIPAAATTTAKRRTRGRVRVGEVAQSGERCVGDARGWSGVTGFDPGQRCAGCYCEAAERDERRDEGTSG